MTHIALLFVAVSHTMDLPPNLLRSVCYVESHHNVQAIHYNDGNGNSVGICQIKLSTARVLGFKGSEAELRDPSVNILYAGMYLRRQLHRYSGDIHKAIAAYNSGKHLVNDDGHTLNQTYVNKVFLAWAEMK